MIDCDNNSLLLNVFNEIKRQTDMLDELMQSNQKLDYVYQLNRRRPKVAGLFPVNNLEQWEKVNAFIKANDPESGALVPVVIIYRFRKITTQ